VSAVGLGSITLGLAGFAWPGHAAGWSIEVALLAGHSAIEYYASTDLSLMQIKSRQRPWA